MTTTTEVDGFRIYEDGDVHESTHYTHDDDLTLNIRKGWDMGGGHRQGIILVQLGIDDHPAHAVAADHYQCIGTPVEALYLAIRQLEKVRPGAEPHRGRRSPYRDWAQRILSRRRC